MAEAVKQDKKKPIESAYEQVKAKVSAVHKHGVYAGASAVGIVLGALTASAGAGFFIYNQLAAKAVSGVPVGGLIAGGALLCVASFFGLAHHSAQAHKAERNIEQIMLPEAGPAPGG